MPSEPIIFDWDSPDHPRGNRQHTFKGHDVEPDEVEGFVERNWDVPAAWIPRGDDKFFVIGTGATGRVLVAAVQILDTGPPRVRVITCYPVED